MSQEPKRGETARPSGLAVFRKDFLASIVVFLVALPLCMGIARACGMPVAAGIITGIVGGLLVGWLSGCPLQVSGPAAGLIVVVQDILDEEHGPQLLALAMIGAGAIQFAAGLLKLGQWFRAVSPAVIEGMLAGIGVVIIAKPLPLMVDGRPPHLACPYPGGSIPASLASAPAAVWAAAFPSAESPNTSWALVLGLATILVLLLWRPLVPKRLKLIPAPFVAVVVTALLLPFVPVALKTVP